MNIPLKPTKVVKETVPLSKLCSENAHPLKAMGDIRGEGTQNNESLGGRKKRKGKKKKERKKNGKKEE